MARDNNGEFIGRAGACHGSHRTGLANALRDLTIAAGLSCRDLAQRLPDAQLKRGTAQIQR